ncbi:hypothetical protein DPX16_2842 [Anabarilius grahami]|uniref:Uncharacterized protein n=1 Tax=Anabarilius grahami TaxID=495550 RepID=A0A3N0YX92_ANAGA|nr:hypothetical protein DPX16_2842 [Anabarilius grahami]
MLRKCSMCHFEPHDHELECPIQPPEGTPTRTIVHLTWTSIPITHFPDSLSRSLHPAVLCFIISVCLFIPEEHSVQILWDHQTASDVFPSRGIGTKLAQMLASAELRLLLLSHRCKYHLDRSQQNRSLRRRHLRPTPGEQPHYEF